MPTFKKVGKKCVVNENLLSFMGVGKGGLKHGHYFCEKPSQSPLHKLITLYMVLSIHMTAKVGPYTHNLHRYVTVVHV